MKNLSLGYVRLKVIYNDQGDPKDFLIVEISSANGMFANFKKEAESKLLSEYTNLNTENLFEEHKDLLNGNKSYWIKGYGKITNEWFNVLLIPLDLEDYYVGIYKNITESIFMQEKLKEHEDDLKESEKKYRKLFETSNDGFWWVNKDGYLQEVNGGLTGILGYSKEELLGSYWTNFVADRHVRSELKEWDQLKFEDNKNRKGIKLLEEIQSQPIAIHADSFRIIQCIKNLLGNALKFTDIHGQVTVTLKEEGSYAVVTVEDNGIGISQDMLELIFQPFQQIYQSNLNHNNRGLGLGLSIGKSIIHMHNGQIWVDSKGLGYGSTFTIKLAKKG